MELNNWQDIVAYLDFNMEDEVTRCFDPREEGAVLVDEFVELPCYPGEPIHHVVVEYISGRAVYTYEVYWGSAVNEQKLSKSVIISG